MKAVCTHPTKKDSLLLQNKDKPTTPSSQVLIKTLHVGLDRKDQQIVQNTTGEAPDGEDHLIIGHEAVGQIQKIGANAQTNIQEGDIVVPTVRRPDNCYNCQNGEPDNCTDGNYQESGIKQKHGYLRHYFTEKPHHLIKVPSYLEQTAVLIEPLSIVEKALRMAKQTQNRVTWQPQNALVLGSGTLGLLTALILRNKGLHVAVADQSNNYKKHMIFYESDIHHYNTNRTTIDQIPHDFGRPDIAIDATGSSQIALKTINITQKNGIAVLMSLTQDENNIQIDASKMNLDLVMNNKAVIGSVSSNKDDFNKSIQRMEELNKTWPNLLTKLITARYPLNRADQALSELNNNIKSIVEL